MQINLQTFNNIISYKNRNAQKKEAISKSYASNPFAQISKDTVQISFKGNDYCSPKNFQVKNLENLRCPVCGLIMLTEKQIGEYVNDIGAKKGQALIDALEKYEDESVITGKPSEDKTGFGIYRPYKKEIVDVYIELAKQNPKLNLLELTKHQAQICINALIAEQLVVIDELKAHIEQEYEGDLKEDLLKRVKKYTKQIKGEDKETFARQKFIFGMKKGLDSERQAKLDEITTKMPTSENDINSFFVQYQRLESPKDVAKKLVQQTRPTAEHITPRALGGSDSYANYFCDCEDCNGKRRTTGFYEWYKGIPGFAERLQKYIEVVRIAIDEDRLDGEYDDYIETFADTILDVSEGEIILEIPEVTNPEKKQMVLKKRFRQIENLRSKHGSLISIRNQIKDEIAKLKSYKHYEDTNKYRKNLEELARIAKEREEIVAQLEALRPPLYEARKEMTSLKTSADSEKNPATKMVLTAQYEEKAKEYARRNGQITQLEARDNELRKRVIILKVQNKTSAAREAALESQYNALRITKSRIEELEEKIAKLGDVNSKEADLNAKIENCDMNIATLEAANEGLLASGFDKNDDSLYQKWLHQNNLLKATETILKSKDCQKMSVSLANAREIIETAKKTIKQEIAQLENQACVCYFINQDMIKTLSKERSNYQTKLDSVLAIKAQVQSLQAQVETLCKGKTPQEIRREYELISNEKRIIFDIYRIGEKKARLERLNEIIEKNEAQFTQLENYENLTNAQYDELISFIEVDEVF
ncbi:MAG: hypothetical protein IJB79_06440 [Candidatus Gastranaerophilales bacterium]|nr:hypothetical protein [Candidatus Gastranaerophilales bacterium]